MKAVGEVSVTSVNSVTSYTITKYQMFKYFADNNIANPARYCFSFSLLVGAFFETFGG